MMDGVSRCAVEFANAYHAGGFGRCAVITPKAQKEQYSFAYPVYAYNSVPLPYSHYRFGYPFMPELLSRLRKMKVDIIHSHSPFMAMSIARSLRKHLDAPVVFTQHTKWNYDIKKGVPTTLLQNLFLRKIYSNIQKADDVWAVSRGAGEYLLDNGYTGDYKVVLNGTDFPKGKADFSSVKHVSQQFDLPENVPVLLFVGRMMWYKGIKLIIESLETLYRDGFNFRMIFVGDGEDLTDIKQMISTKGLTHVIHCAGRITDREILRAYYTRADLFVFPSVYDTAGLVVSEAAACSCPSLVVRGSAAAEVIEHNTSGFLSGKTTQSIANTIKAALSNPTHLKAVGATAADKIYLSWNDNVEKSVILYERLLKQWNSYKT